MATYNASAQTESFSPVVNRFSTTKGATSGDNRWRDYPQSPCKRHNGLEERDATTLSRPKRRYSGSPHPALAVDAGEEIVPPSQMLARDSPRQSSSAFTSPSTHSATFEEDVPIRTASISRNLPLNHPRADLQSAQGAYVKNVERLEESAERLSMTSSLEDELQKMKSEQRPSSRYRKTSAPVRANPSFGTSSRQVSAASLSNSITCVYATARSGGYSPAGYVYQGSRATSWGAPRPQRSASSRSQPDAMHGSFSEEADEDDSVPPVPPAHSTLFLSNGLQVSPEVHQASQFQRNPSSASTAASIDTYRQGMTLFQDFDGVFYAPSLSHHNSVDSRQVSLSQPPLAQDATPHDEPIPGESTVFYPAPIPKMLNLPPKLAPEGPKDREKRRLLGISGISADMRKSAPWLDGPGGEDNAAILRQKLKSLPPQLRASAFFDSPDSYSGVAPDLKIENGSATATLDKLLDASASAPAHAFTDHLITGKDKKTKKEKQKSQLSGAAISKITEDEDERETSRKAKRSSSGSSLGNMLGIGRKASGGTVDDMGRSVSGSSVQQRVHEQLETGKWRNLQEYSSNLHEGDGDKNSIPDLLDQTDLANIGNEDLASDGSGDDEEASSAFVAAPTTLLAEIEMRKTQQKARNLPAADVLSATDNHESHGTYTTLLERDAITRLQMKSRKQKHVTLAWQDENEAERINHGDDDVPLGVLYPGREQELTGGKVGGLLALRELEDNEPLSARKVRMNPSARSMAGSQQVDPQDDEEEASETLAERLKRLRAEKEAQDSNDAGGTTSETPDPDETLGQRKKRLQDEAAKKTRQVSGGSKYSQEYMQQSALVKPRSIASVHSARNAVKAGPQVRNVSGGSGSSQQGQNTQMVGYGMQYAPTMSTEGGQIPMQMGYNPYQLQQMQMQPPPQFGYHYADGNMMQQPMMPPFHNPSIPPSNFNNNVNQPYFNPYMMNMQMQMNANMNMPMPLMGMPPGMGMPMGFDPVGMGPPLNPRQRQGIDRWRQGVDGVAS